MTRRRAPGPLRGTNCLMATTLLEPRPHSLNLVALSIPLLDSQGYSKRKTQAQEKAALLGTAQPEFSHQAPGSGLPRQTVGSPCAWSPFCDSRGLVLSRSTACRVCMGHMMDFQALGPRVIASLIHPLERELEASVGSPGGMDWPPFSFISSFFTSHQGRFRPRCREGTQQKAAQPPIHMASTSSKTDRAQPFHLPGPTCQEAQELASSSCCPREEHRGQG